MRSCVLAIESSWLLLEYDLVINLSLAPPAPDSPWRTTWELLDVRDIQDLTDVDLHYRYFAVSVTFEIDGEVVIDPMRYVPLFDFLASAAWAQRQVEAGKNAAIGFTESLDRVRFTRRGDLVSVRASNSGIEAEVLADDLTEALGQVLGEGRRLFEQVNPELLSVPLIRDLFAGDG